MSERVGSYVIVEMQGLGLGLGLRIKVQAKFGLGRQGACQGRGRVRTWFGTTEQHRGQGWEEDTGWEA